MTPRDHSNTRGFVPYQDPGIPGVTYYQTSQGWASVRTQLAYLGCLR